MFAHKYGKCHNIHPPVTHGDRLLSTRVVGVRRRAVRCAPVPYETASGGRGMEGGRRMDHRLFQGGQWTLRLRERWSQIGLRIIAFIAPVAERARVTWTETPRWSQRLALGALGVATLTLIAATV